MRNEPPHADLIAPTIPIAAQPLVCHRCGRTIQPPKLDCADCLKAAYRKAMLDRQRQIIFAQPHIKFALARDARTRVAHIAMFGDHRLMFCGKKVTQPKHQREEQAIANFPPGVCERCQAALQETLSS
jgi:hypothetical protein